MQIRPEELGAEEAYKLLTGMVVPRPIAWITTLSATGSVNVAPFSAFTFVSPKPPMVAVSIGHKAGVYKDTAQNILRSEEYVVHIADQPLIEAVHGSAVEYPPDVSEAEVLGLETIASEKVAPPRLAAPPVAMECRFRSCIEFGETRSRLIVGEVLMFHVRDGLARNGKIDTLELNPICRLGGPNYATLGEVVTLTAIAQTPKS